MARRKVPVVLLESHRDFRGETILPSTLEVLDQLGLADRLLQIPRKASPGFNRRFRRARLRTPSRPRVERLEGDDGRGNARCLRGRTLAFTSPGSRAVWACPTFALEQRRDPGFAEATIIHETLHYTASSAKRWRAANGSPC